MLLSTEERIVLRDELSREFKDRAIFRSNHISKSKLKQALVGDDSFTDMYTSYVSQFRSEKEALYCIRHHDDISNHLCPICNSPTSFYTSSRIQKYRDTCGSQECYKKLHYTSTSQKKAKGTFMQKYGVSNPSSCKAIQMKIGVAKKMKLCNNNPLTQEEIECALQSTIERFRLVDAHETYNKLKVHIKHAKIYNSYDAMKYFIKLLYEMKHRPLISTELANIFNVHKYSIILKLKKLELEHYLLTLDSTFETQLRMLLEHNHISYDRNNRVILNPQEIDFFISSCKLGIEVNECSTHNIKKKSKRYHLQKTLLAQTKGIRLIHIWEWELTDEVLWNRLSRWLLNLVNSSKKVIDSNQCKVMILSEDGQHGFLNNYSLEGYAKADVAYALYNQSKLISLASFKKLDDSSANRYELVRLVTRYGYTVNSYKPLLDSFVRDYKPCAIVANVNLDKHIGTIYEDLGFKLTSLHEPNAIWFNPYAGQVMNEVDHGNFQRSSHKSVYNCGTKIYLLREPRAKA